LRDKVSAYGTEYFWRSLLARARRRIPGRLVATVSVHFQPP
jgi:hypothetical protein